MARLLFILSIALGLHAQFHLNGVSTTPTQATISYNPGTSAACTLNVTDSTGATVSDVNTALGGDFAGSNLDSRAGNGALGNNRTFVVGQRTTGVAANGFPYSRALTALSVYTGQFTCNGFASPAFTFTTQNIPVGDTHNEGVPVDRAHPGKYALEGMRWTVGTQKFIDPFKGISATRTTAPADVATTAQAFVTAIGGAGWSGSPISGTATFAGTGSMSDAMFTRADGFTLGCGATYAADGCTSLDWATASITGSTSGSSSVVRCLVVNGVSCPANTQVTTVLTGTPTVIPTGSGALMDLWQSSGPAQISAADVSTATGTASIASGVVTWVSGNKFSIKWTNGSKITIGGTAYTISSVQSELQLTLTTTPTAAAAAYTANNFGVLWWCTAACTLTNATYAYGSAAMPSWPDGAFNSTSPVWTINGETGFYTFVGDQMYWVLSNGSATRLLGSPYTSSASGSWPSNINCNDNSAGYSWDPVVPATMWCAISYFDGTYHLVQAQYKGNNQTTPGNWNNTPTNPLGTIVDCFVTGGVQPCIQYTQMSNPIVAEGIALKPSCSSLTIGGVPQAGMGGSFYGFGIWQAQNTFACIFMLTVGTDVPRTPEGTDAGSVTLIAATDTWSTAPWSWCNLHANPGSPSSSNPGWIGMDSNNETIPSQTYTTTLTSGTMGTVLSACPPNPLGVVGNSCTPITISGQPVNSSSATLQNIQVGDVWEFSGDANEAFRFVQVTPSYVTQRGYLGSTISAHAGETVMVMECGCLGVFALGNAIQGGSGVWDFVHDPTGTNPTFATKLPWIYAGGHGNAGVAAQAATIQAVGGLSPTPALCPVAAGYCEETWPGDYISAARTGQIGSAISISPYFAGLAGLSAPNQVDDHPGPCGLGWCMSARPFNGGPPSVCSVSNPFVNTTGFLWKCAAANAPLNRKILTTLMYVGRSALVDVSGPGSVIGGASADNYKGCVTLIAGECVAGSTVGDVYVNAPYVSLPYCNENAANGSQGDDNNYICIADLGAYTGQIAQMGWTTNDITGATSRGLGGAHNVWNQQYGFWNAGNVPNGQISGNYARWLDGIRTEVITAILPPFPSPDAVNRGTFVPVTVTMNPPSGVTGESVNFWYAELGLGCTSRQESCSVSAAAINQTTPYQFASESITPLSCTANCQIQIPALSGHTVYYQTKYWKSAAVIFTGPVQQVTTP